MHGGWFEDQSTGVHRQAGWSLLEATESVFTTFSSLPAMITPRKSDPLSLMFNGKWQPFGKSSVLAMDRLPDGDLASVQLWFDSTAALELA